MSQPAYPCDFCGFPLDAAVPEAELDGVPRCSVCRDGQADPWAIIRAIRSQIGRVTGHASAPTESREFASLQISETDRRFLLLCLDSLWPGLSFAGVAPAELGPDDIADALVRSYDYDVRAARLLTRSFLYRHERLHGYWGIVADSVVHRWRRLLPEDVDEVEPSLTGLAGLLAAQYELSDREARVKVLALLEELHLPTLLRLAPRTPQEPEPPANR